MTDFNQQFITTVQKDFAFLVSEFGCAYCGHFESDQGTRDSETWIRYIRPDRVIDVTVSIGPGLFVYVRKVDHPVNASNCRTVVPAVTVSFEMFLLARHQSDLSFPFPEMKPHKVFVTLYNQRPLKYGRILFSRWPAAVKILADRFRAYGRELLLADLVKLAAETKMMSLETDKPHQC